MLKKLPKSQIGFEISVSWKDWGKYLDVAANEASEEINIPGFRPGKAPRNIVEQKVGKEVILNNAAEKAVKKSYVDFVMAEKLEVIGNPNVALEKIEEGKDLKYKVSVSVMPEIKIKENYADKVKTINKDYGKKTITVEEKDLDLELEKLANSRVKLVTVRREARKGDSVEIDFSVLVGGVPIENGTSKKHPLIIGRGVFIPGFEEAITGMKEGEEKEFELNFPPDYHKKDLAGKLAKFKVKMDLVQERQTPEINDEFAMSMGKFENLSALKKSVQDGLEHELEHKTKDKKRADYMAEIIKHSEIDLPDILVDEEVARMFSEFESQIQPMGMNMDQYLAKLKKDRKELEKDWRPEAKKRVIGALALKEIAKTRSLEAASAEIEEEMNKIMQYYKNVKDIEKNIDTERLYNYCKGNLENEKVFEYLEKL